MKRQVLGLAIAMILTSGVCMAQKERRERPDRGASIETMITDLGLNETQAAQFKAVMENIKPGKPEDGERPSREEMDKKRDEMDKKIKSILTEEQYKKFQSMQPKKGDRKGKRD